MRGEAPELVTDNKTNVANKKTWNWIKLTIQFQL